MDTALESAEPLISVIIPTWQRAAWIEGAVRSVLEQSHTRLECLVVDDGSTDATDALLDKLAAEDSRVIVLRQENMGVSAARNAGIERASGEFIALLDSDDHWLPHKLARQLAFMRRHNLEISQTEEIWMRGGVRVNPGKKHRKQGGRFFAKSLERCMVSPSCTMFTQLFWEAVGPFDERLRACEDYDLWLRALLQYDIGLLPEALTIRNGGRQDQLSASMLGQDLYRIYALCKLLDDAALAGQEREQTEKVLRKKTDIYVKGCYKRGRQEEGQRIAALVAEALCGAGSV